MQTATPIVIAFVLALAFALLLWAFRSPKLAATVVGLNLLSVGAAFGLLVAVFQHSWAEDLLGFTSSGTIVSWLPLFSFVILFGLSMDYTVLVLERIRESRRAGRPPADAAAEGIAATAGTVTSAAVVMVAIFAVFATLRLLDMKQMGFGLAAAVLLDVTIVRGVALPAAITLLGERGWRCRARGGSAPSPASRSRPRMAGEELTMSTRHSPIQPGSALSLQIALSALLGLRHHRSCGRSPASSYFWPAWIWFAAGRRRRRAPGDPAWPVGAARPAPGAAHPGARRPR